jgi:acyl-CoA synthetase (AMP-forming)/AMP-acid ligase II
MIIRSGFNVYPAEVEAVINAHESVDQSVVVGRLAGGNEEVVAFVQLRPGAKIDAVTLAAYLRERITAYKRPARFVFLDALPVLSNGKIERSALKAMAQSLDEAADPTPRRTRR